MSAFFQSRKQRILPTILAAVGIPLVLCVEAPFEIYGVNLDEFLFSLSDFFPFCLLFAFLGFLTLASLLYFIPKAVYRFVYPVVVAIGFLFFLQGTYLNLGLSSLPGDNMSGDELSVASLVLNTLVWVLLLAAAIGTALLKKRDIVKIVCVILSAMVIGIQLVNLVFVALSNDQITVSKYERMQQSTSERTPKVMTGNGLTTLGEDGNVIIFIVDRFDEAYAERAYRKDPKVFGELTGFTWFQDYISMFGHTYPAVTWMLTQAPFDPAVDRLEYQNSAFQGDTPLKELHENGYRIRLYTQAMYAYSTESSLPAYVENVVPVEKPAPISTGNKVKVAGNMIAMALYRCLPFVMKGLVGNISSSANDLIVMESQENAYVLDMKHVFQTVTGEDFTTEKGKVFNFIHVDGCHSINYNDRWETPTGSDVGDPAVSVRTSFQIIDRYLQEMKRLGVYDNATIVITGDHSAAHSDTREVREPRLTALFAKPAHSGEQAIKISSAQVSHAEFWGTVFRSEGIDTGSRYTDSVFDIPERTDRTRYHCWQTYMKGSLDEYLYAITGAGDDIDNWEVIRLRHYDKFLMD